MPERETIEWRRAVPVRYEADVAVVGGGIAGVSAACAAAKSGASVVLVERFAVTGGVMTTGGVGNFCGELTGQGEVFDEIVAGLRAFGALGECDRETAYGRETTFDHEILAVVLQEMLLRRGVKLLLHTRFVDARAKAGELAECLVCGASGPEALRARQFIDCTGEGQVAHAAGFATMKGRPGDGLQLPMSMMFFVRETDPPVEPQVPEGWFDAIRSEEDLPMTGAVPNGPGGKAIKIKVPMFDATDTEGLTAAEVRARRRMMEVLDYYQRVAKKPWRFDRCSSIIGIREGRRIVGDYVLTVDDLRAGRTFDDAIARGTYTLDAHDPADDKRTYILPANERVVPPYQIPWRALVAKDGRNLAMAGRCFSADQLALSSARVATTASMLGQAAGVAAALAAKQKCSLRDVPGTEVRRIVEGRGARLDV
jgi:hypothetical protein